MHLTTKITRLYTGPVTMVSHASTCCSIGILCDVIAGLA